MIKKMLRRMFGFAHGGEPTRPAQPAQKEVDLFCPVTNLFPCPWHPDGGNHPDVGRG